MFLGSGVIPAMSGATDDRMAEAIEASDVVIICISRQYKESANCRQEAKYANDLFKRGKLHIVYVMMDQNYHTRSSPDSVNGWLGIMVSCISLFCRIYVLILICVVVGW